MPLAIKNRSKRYIKIHDIFQIEPSLPLNLKEKVIQQNRLSKTLRAFQLIVQAPFDVVYLRKFLIIRAPSDTLSWRVIPNLFIHQTQ